MEQSARRALRNLPTLDYRALHNRGEAVKLNAMTNSDSDSSSPAEPVASAAAADAGDTMAAQDQQQAAPQASFAEWAKDHHLTAATCQVLADNGCDAVPIVLSLLEEDIREMQLNIGQRRMLLRAVNPAGNARRHSETATPRGTSQPAAQLHAPPIGSGATPGAGAPPTLQPSGGEPLLADLLNAAQGQGRQDGGAQLDVNKTVPSAVTDPEIYLHLAASKGEADYYDIVDFVPGDLGSASASESVLSTGTDIELVARTVNSKRTKLYAVTPQQWTAANSAIMARLIQDGMLGSVGINQYLNYSFKVGELGQVYAWQSVLTYDRSYRKLQARLNFPWGTDISHLRTTTLMPKVSSSGLSRGGPNRNPGRGMGKTTPAYKDEGFNVRFNLCRDYNRGSCNREQCKFTHRCGVTGCFGKHTAASHHEQTATKNG